MPKRELTQQEVNILLKHSIKNGDHLNQYIERPPNEILPIEYGDVHYTVQYIKKFINKYHKQVSKLSAFLKKESLLATAKSIHQFMRDYIQYEIDMELQRMRTPANIWENRILGTDCKGFTTFSGSILKNLGISFYIREVKQRNFKPNNWTHVYIVIPKNQKTGDLKDGNIVLDGTVDFNTIPKIVDKRDIFMDRLPHIGLNGAVAPKKAKKPTAKQIAARKKFAKMAKDGTLKKLREKTSKKGLNAASPKTKTARKLCSPIIVREGLKKDGTLKKGYKYASGGKIVKVSKSKSGLNAGLNKQKKTAVKKTSKKGFPFS